MADSRPKSFGNRGHVLLSALLCGACSGDVGGSAGAPENAAPGSAPSSSDAVFTPGGAVVGAPGLEMGATGLPAAPGAVASGAAAPGSPSAAPGTPAATAAPGDPEPLPGPRPGLVARISKGEYRNSVLDVLGVELSDADLEAIPADTGDGVFKHFADKQTSVEQHALGYFEVAAVVAERVDIDVLFAPHAECASDSVGCGTAFIAALGRRLFRRSLDERETALYQNLFDTALTETGASADAARWTLEALLQAPAFLFHIEDEIGGTAGLSRSVNAHELAARMASFLWVSVPDDALLEAADSGALLAEATFDAEVARMLADRKAERFTSAFIADFSRAGLASFEGVTEESRLGLSESVTATFQHHFWEAGRSVAELFTTTEFMVNPVTAEILGVPSSGAGLELVDVSSLPERVGIMTHPGTVAGMGDRNIGSFVSRGKYMMERLLCRNPIAFPAALLPEVEGFVADTTGFNEHERMEVRKTRPECWLCHQQFDPLAIGFSRFDGAGRYLGDTDAAGKSLSLAGWVPTTTEDAAPKYTNVTEYMQILATEPMVQTCMTEHFLAFATARQTDDTAKAYAAVVGAEYAADGSTLFAMVTAVARSELFKGIRAVSPTELATEGEE